ncbi:MAG: permease-like cell division protein FtsX [Pseudomonadota bacterium]
MKSWLRQHRFALRDAFGRVRKTPGSFLFNVLVVAIALALPFAGLTILENVRPVSQQLAVEPEISIFMAMDTPREQAAALGARIQKVVQENNAKGRLEFIPRENALSALKNRSGLSDALTTLGANPLPDGYVLKLANFDNAADATRIDMIASKLKTLPGVEYVQVDSAWVKRLAALLHLARLALLMFGTTLGVVVVAVVFNTIRLQVMTQQEEIEVSRLLGATDAFIYRPFYYSGALLGLCAGVVALAAVALALNPLNAAIADFARLYASEFRLVTVGAPLGLLLLVLSAALGLSGAVLSVQRHLSR